MTRVFKIFHKPISEQVFECLLAVEFISTRTKVSYRSDVFITMSMDGVLHYNLAGAALIRTMGIRDPQVFQHFIQEDSVKQFAEAFDVPLEALVKFEKRMRLLEQHQFDALLDDMLLHPRAHSFLTSKLQQPDATTPPSYPTFEANPVSWRLMVGKLIGALVAAGY